mgnify:CR=1 FL=1
MPALPETCPAVGVGLRRSMRWKLLALGLLLSLLLTLAIPGGFFLFLPLIALPLAFGAKNDREG